MAHARIEFQLNGAASSLPTGATISDLLADIGLAGRRVAVEVNGAIVPRGLHAGQALNAGDRVEIVHALGGG